MILYHGSNISIYSIDFDKYRPFKDFGKGFYLTEIKSQAIQMAHRTATIYGGEPIVTAFEFDYHEALTSGNIQIMHFTEPTKDWALFIMKNRNHSATQPTHDFDIVIGPVTDDAIATLFRNFNDGIIDLDMLVSGLKFKKISSQYFFHTPQSIKYLRKL